MKSNHNVMETNKNPKRNLTGEAAIFRENAREKSLSENRISAEAGEMRNVVLCT